MDMRTNVKAVLDHRARLGTSPVNMHELAKELGVSRSGLSHYLGRGRGRRAAVLELAQVAEALGVSVDDLIFWDGRL